MDAATLAALREASRSREAHTLAMSLVSRARHTRAALARKLERRGYDRPLVDRVLDRLTELGCLDDEAAGEGWLRRRIERNTEGRNALLAGLLRNGVPRETAERLLLLYLPAEREAEAARAALRRLSRGGAMEPAASYRRLVARGFSPRAAREAVFGAAGGPDGEQ